LSDARWAALHDRQCARCPLGSVVDSPWRIGYLTQLAEPERLEEEVGALVRDCASMAPIALTGMKHHLNRIARGTLDPQALDASIRSAYLSEDLREGQSAWAQKRAAKFQGK